MGAAMTTKREKAMRRLGAKMPKLSSLKHPMQPVGFDSDNIVRFKENEIVRFLVDACALGYKFDLNDLAIHMQSKSFERFPVVADPHSLASSSKTFTVPQKPFSKADYTQLMQLIGYSTSGFGELSRVDKKAVAVADAEAEKIWKKNGG
jgi:hypothetical protein